MVDDSQILEPLAQCSIGKELACHGYLYYGVIVCTVLVIMMFVHSNIDEVKWWTGPVAVAGALLIGFIVRMGYCSKYNAVVGIAKKEMREMDGGGEESESTEESYCHDKVKYLTECSVRKEMVCASTKIFYSMIAIVIVLLL